MFLLEENGPILPKFMSTCLKDIDHTSPNLNLIFHFFKILLPYARCSTFPFHVVWRYWFRIQAFQEIARHISMIVRCPSFPNFSKASIPKIVRFPKTMLIENDLESFLEGFGVSRCLQRSKWLVWGVMDMSRNPQIMKIMGFRVFQ